MWAVGQTVPSHPLNTEAQGLGQHPPPNRRRNPNKSANKSADQFFGKTGPPVPWISVPGPKHTFLLVAQ